MCSKGIDYSGVGATCNRDLETGIRYGIIPQNDILQAWADSSEPDYGELHCPKCGNNLDDGDYLAASDSEGDVWVYRSPYYTRAQFCSPCAPGEKSKVVTPETEELLKDVVVTSPEVEELLKDLRHQVGSVLPLMGYPTGLLQQAMI